MENDKILFLCKSFRLKRGQSWAIFGRNGTGKSQFAQTLGRLNKSVLISFEKINEIIENDRRDDAYISEDNFLSPGQKVCDIMENNEYMKKFGVAHTINTSIRHLSTGELAKILIISALCENPDILVLDEPFDGLDAKSRVELSRIIGELIEKKISVIIFLNRIEEILPGITNLAFMGNGHSFLISGEKEEIENSKEFRQLLHFSSKKIKKIPQNINKNTQVLDENYAVLKNVCIKYGEKIILNNLNWTLKKGEHWHISGPNGCGKSTLLSIISGDNPQSFVNDIELFGKKRGQGETIWEIKKNIGIVSTLFHRDYRVSISARNVIISGFHDTIGIYKKPDLSEIEAANCWLELAGMSNSANQSFMKLSCGEQRLLLILRAMVKHPPILILDEPCFGLDSINRELVLNLTEILASSPETTILFVSHHEEDVIKNIKNRLEFVPSQDGYNLIERRTP